MTPRDQNPRTRSPVAPAAGEPSERPVYVSGGWEIDCGRRELRSRGIAVPIGSRAFEILEAMVESAGELVTKGDLMAKVWPGAVVEDNALQVHISAIRKTLGTDRGMMKTVSGRGYRLLGNWSISDGSAQAAPDAALGPRPLHLSFRTNIPLAASALVGREEAMLQLGDLLTAYRVVTLRGPGGIGKTALAAEVARRLLAALEGDALFVELVTLADPGLVPSAAVNALGLQLGGDVISADSVARAIGGRKVLVVLDNCEHVIDAAASLAETLVRLCPRTTILATSREALRIDGEYVFYVAPLDVPSQQEAAANALEHSAVQLFIARTKSLRADFSVDAESLPTIGTICRRLDGIPLAIEFAAARAATLGLKQVAARLDDRFAFLTGGRRTALPRHQTLRATLDWSYELLPESERFLLRRLGIFPAAFTLDAAKSVMDENVANIEDGISSLVSKSLLTLVGSASERRWRLLETIRAYAQEKLVSSGEFPAAARRQARYFQRRLRSMQAEWKETQTDYGASLDELVANTRAGLDWAFSSAGDETLGIDLTAASISLWLRLSLLGECRERAERALAALDRVADLEPGIEMLLRAAQGLCLMYTRGPVGEAESIWARVFELAEQISDAEYQLRALYGLWLYKFLICEFRVALELSQRFRDVAEYRGIVAELPTADRMACIVLHFLGDQAEGCAFAERAIGAPVLGNRNFRTTHYGTDQRVGPSVFLARALWLQGHPDQAMKTIVASVEEAAKVGHANSTCIALADGACFLSILVDDVAGARRYAAMLTDDAERHALGVWRTYALAVRGRLLMREDAAGGAALLTSALTELQSTPYDVRFTLYSAWLAETLGEAGRYTAGLSAVDSALQRAESTDERWFFPELLRIRGKLLLAEGGSRAVGSAGDCFARSLDWAQKQKALSWELRTTMELARLRRAEIGAARSRDLLRSVYSRFTEGFQTGDLLAARGLLAELAA